jgi:hypothetical protein
MGGNNSSEPLNDGPYDTNSKVYQEYDKVLKRYKKNEQKLRGWLNSDPGTQNSIKDEMECDGKILSILNLALREIDDKLDELRKKNKREIEKMETELADLRQKNADLTQRIRNTDDKNSILVQKDEQRQKEMTDLDEQRQKEMTDLDEQRQTEMANLKKLALGGAGVASALGYHVGRKKSQSANRSRRRSKRVTSGRRRYGVRRSRRQQSARQEYSTPVYG